MAPDSAVCVVVGVLRVIVLSHWPHVAEHVSECESTNKHRPWSSTSSSPPEAVVATNTALKLEQVSADADKPARRDDSRPSRCTQRYDDLTTVVGRLLITLATIDA